MTSIFGYNKEFPAHISVGAVVVNDAGKIMCHHFERIKDFAELYILMRETPEEDESIEQALHRGLREEFGAQAQIVHYLGSIQSTHKPNEVFEVEKTTIYFLCRLSDLRPETRFSEDPESGSEIMFLPPSELIEKMSDQAIRYPERSDLDESKIIKTLLRLDNK